MVYALLGLAVALCSPTDTIPGCRVPGVGFRIQGSGCRVPGVGFRI